MPIATKEKLAQVLHAAGLFDLERRARAGEFDDFESEVHALPKVALVKELRSSGHDKLAQRAIEGEWDNTKEEAEAWANSGEGREIIKELFRDD